MNTDWCAPELDGKKPFGCCIRSCGEGGKQKTVEINKDIRVEGKSLAELQLAVTTAPDFSREDDMEALVNQVVAVLERLAEDVRVFLAVG